MNQDKIKILVVDDTEATRYAISRTLRASGYDTVEACNGSEALVLSLSERPHLITLDIHLPDILGFEVCRRIKANPLTANIPVLQVSASYVGSKDLIHGLEGGADSYLTHPFEPPVLLATVKALLRSRKLNNDLAVSEERFRVALKNAPIMIYTCDLDLRYTWIYNSPQPLTSLSFIGRTDCDIFNAEDAKKLIDFKQRTLTTRSGNRALLTLKITENHRSYDLTAEPLFDTGGVLEGLTVACIDISERIEAENAYKLATEEAKIANQAKSRFLSNMSHEIRTPLGVIQGFSELALDPSVSPLERKEYLETVRRNAHALSKLLGEILDLSKIEAGRIDIEKTKFPLLELVNEIVQALDLQAKTKGIGLKFQVVDPFPGTIVSDPIRVRQILLNLVSNSIKFTSVGEVEITAQLAANQNDILEFFVRDTGVGIHPDHQPRLFQAFMQADSSITRKFGGTGLGLNLSKKLAQALGGDLVLVSSKEGEGSIFKFSLDAGHLSDEDFVARSSTKTAFSDATPLKFIEELSGLRVLLVEDSVDNQRLFSRYLNLAGAFVEVASNGAEGVEKARRFDFDVILMDLQMPTLDGYAATKILRANGNSVPIVALTAHAAKEEQQDALKKGFSHYLTKPLSPNLLVKTLAKFRSSSFN